MTILVMKGQVSVKPTSELLIADRGRLDLLKCCCQRNSHKEDWERLYELQDDLDIL